jgi:hypothetical protein
MAQFWTEDPSIGNALAGLADSFSYKGQVAIANSMEDLKKKRAEAAARQDAIDANNAMWNARKAPTVAPQTPNQTAWATGAGPIGAENVPVGGQMQPLRALTPDVAANDAVATAAAQSDQNAEFNRVRAKQLADSGLVYRVGSGGEVASHAAPMEAQAQLDMYGVPKTLEGQYKMQTQLTGQLPMLDVKGTTNNWTATDPVTGKTTSGQTRDGRTDLNTGQLLPPGALKMGDVSADQSPFKDEGSRLKALDALTSKVAIGNQPLTADEKQRANILLATNYPNVQKVERDSAGNLRVIGYNEKVVPSVYAPLIAHLNAGIAGPPPAATPAGQSALPAGPVPTMGGAPGQRATVPDALATTATTPPAGPATQRDNPPIVPAGALSTTGLSASQPLVQGTGDEQLKEIINHPAVKGAIDATRAYNELLAAAQAKTPESDLHMIYMLAKIYDPNSVVREGEVATASNTSPAYEKWWGMYNKQKEAGSALSDRARASFIDEGFKAAQAHYDAAKGLVDYAGQRAERLGLDPRNVMPPLEAPQRQGAPSTTTSAPARTGPHEVSTADREAIAWARANPKDPRASQILRQNGMQ